MDILRKHWYDLGGVLAIFTLIGIWIFHTYMSSYQIVLWMSLVSLFFHQLEEYRIVGTFPGMVNSAMYHSDLPDRYPLNTNTSLYVNVFVGWVSYFLAALFHENAVWLGIASILVSLGNTVAHTTVFNIKGKTVYNAGLVTCWIFFAPIIYLFFKTITEENLATLLDYILGIVAGIVLNVVGIVKMIDWFKDRNTTYVFEQRNLLPKDRKK